MLTGTPLDLTFIPELLRWLGIVIPIVWLLLLVGALVLAWRRGRTPVGRAVGIAVALAVLLAAPFLMLNALRKDALLEQAKQEAQEAEFKARYEKAEALFKKRCETAGEFINKTVPEVKGVVWMKWRISDGIQSKQFDMDDPYGVDCGDESCIEQLLRSTFVIPNHDMNKPLLPENGYEFVEAADPRDGQTYRYVAGVFAIRKRTPENRVIATRNNNGVDPGEDVFDFGIQRQAVNHFSARYGVTWDDVSTREDRENWIAGGSITVIDLKTNEVIAKRVGYMMDPGLGSTAGFRDPWGLFARHNSCPVPPPRSSTDDRPIPREDEKTAFLFKVLQPTKGDNK